jgi:serine phosphatase RsbU (regulator of sigma subunit)
MTKRSLQRFLFENRQIKQLERFSILPLKNRIQLSTAYFLFAFTVAMLVHIMLKNISPPSSIAVAYLFSALLGTVWTLCLLIPALRKYHSILVIFVSVLYALAIAVQQSYFSLNAEEIVTSQGRHISLENIDWVVVGLAAAILVIMSVAVSMYTKVVEFQSERQASLNAELQVAEKIQKQLVPDISVRLSGVDIFGRCLPAAQAGGDFIDCIRLSGTRYLAVIGDVSGHGIGAAVTMAMVKGALHALAESFTDLESLLKKLNHFIYQNSAKQMFVSLTALVVDEENRIIEYVNAGHMPGLIKTVPGAITELAHKSLVLGIVPHAEFPSQKINWSAPMELLIYTDGINEAVNSDGEEFGTDRIRNILIPAAQSASQIVNQMLSEVSLFSAEWNDDRTLLCMVFA